jgi:hypothetical protein
MCDYMAHRESPIPFYKDAQSHNSSHPDLILIITGRYDTPHKLSGQSPW